MIILFVGKILYDDTNFYEVAWHLFELSFGYVAFSDMDDDHYDQYWFPICDPELKVDHINLLITLDQRNIR